MDYSLEKKLSRLADKLAEASSHLTGVMMRDEAAYKAYVAVCEAQAILWMVGEEAQEDITRLAEELEAKLLQKGW